MTYYVPTRSQQLVAFVRKRDKRVQAYRVSSTDNDIHSPMAYALYEATVCPFSVAADGREGTGETEAGGGEKGQGVEEETSVCELLPAALKHDL